MKTATALLDQVVEIVEHYLGPTAERFVRRQIVFHLNKDPADLSSEDIPKLAEWVKVTIGLLTEDKSMVEDVATEITKLAESTPAKR